MTWRADGGGTEMSHMAFAETDVSRGPRRATLGKRPGFIHDDSWQIGINIKSLKHGEAPALISLFAELPRPFSGVVLDIIQTGRHPTVYRRRLSPPEMAWGHQAFPDALSASAELYRF